MDNNIDTIIAGLMETVIFLGVSCYSDDPEKQDKLVRMGFAINDAIEILKRVQEKEAEGCQTVS